MGSYSTGLVIATSIVLTAGLVWLLQPVAYRLGLLDRPGGRKDHAQPTPITGGLAIAVAVFISLSIIQGNMHAFLAYAAASSLLIVIGLLDDAYDIRWWWRLCAQTVAALMMVYWGGVQVHYVGHVFTDTPIVLGYWSVPFTVFATVGIINAVNMSDGVDGLAGTLCLAGLTMIGLAALYAGNQSLFANLVPLAASVAAFLAFNMRFPWQKRARVFMGNAGSAFLGLSMAWVAFSLTQNASHPVSPILAPWLLAPPLVDCLVLIARRLKMGRSPFAADRGHIHHLMLDAGFSAGGVASFLGVLSLLLGLLAALVLRSTWGSEGHLALGFCLLVVGYYWLTARRDRAVRSFAHLRRALQRVFQFDPIGESGKVESLARK